MSAASYEQDGTLVLENAWVRLIVDKRTAAIRSLYDKRTQAEALSERWQLTLDGEPISGIFAASVLPADDELAAILISGIDGAKSLGWSIQAALLHISPSVSLSLTLFNRGDDRRTATIDLHRNEEDTQNVLAASDPLSPVDLFQPSSISIHPYQTIRLRANISPKFISGGRTFGSKSLIVSCHQDSMSIEALTHLPKSRIVLKLENGETVEASADLSHERPTAIAYDKLSAKPRSIRIVDAHGASLFERADLEGEPDSSKHTSAHPADALETMNWNMQDSINQSILPHLNPKVRQAFPMLAIDPRRASWAYLQLAFASMTEQRWAEAATFANESLVHNSANPIAWWLKHTAVWKLGEDDPDALVNAHYLAPHEPLLKADAFLRNTEGGEKLLDAWADNPSPFRDVANFLILCGLFEELYLWLTEATKRTTDAMLQAELAWAYKRVGKDIEAAAVLNAVESQSKSLEPNTMPERFIAQDLGLWIPPL
ncbi:MAG: hypothetical protein KIT74_05150 [Fimbriimonadales bacterium]|nr:hypothetical protein [Fimbriimonadales bacterium]